MLYTIFILYSVFISVTKGYTYADEESLRTSIFTGYNNDIRPETPIDVRLSMTLMSLNYLDIGAQEMCVNIVLISTWTDNRLVWTPASHNNINTLVVKYSTVWLPSLVLENTIDDAGLFGSDETAPVRVDSSGLVTWISPAYARVSCNMEVTYFPFDQQTCKISVYGWAQDITEMDLKTFAAPWYLAEYQENGEWSLDDTSVSQHLASDGANTFKSLYFKATFRRKWQFPFLALIVPAIMNSVLMCAVFYLPFETDKPAYSLTVLLSYYVLLTYVSDTLPATSTNISILQAYLTYVMIVGTVTTLLSVWTVAMYNRDESKPIPPSAAYLYHNVMTIFICKKGSCKRVSYLCHSCGSRRKKTTQVHDRGHRFDPSTTPGTRPGAKSTFLSPRGDGRNTVSEGNEIKAFNNQRETIVKSGKLSKNNEELPNVHDMSIASTDGGYENANNTIKEKEALPCSTDNNSSGNAFNKQYNSADNFCTCTKHNKSFTMFNQQPREGGKDNKMCYYCGKRLSVEEANAVIEEEEDDTEKELTWKMIAERMDAIFFRVVSLSIALFTIILIIVLFATY